MSWFLIQYDIGSKVILLHVDTQFFQHQISNLLWHCCQRSADHKHVGLFLGSLFCFIDLYVCFYVSGRHTVLITLALQYSLKSGSGMPPVLFFLPKIALTMWDILQLHLNFRLSYFCKECLWYFNRVYHESGDHIG